MKLRSLIYTLSGLALAASLSSCDSEKDFLIIDGDLPIKTSTLYMVGDATPNGWSIDDPTPLEPGEEDPLVFHWEGNLNAGEMKLCLTPGSWDAPFIRPVNNGEEIGKSEITDVRFDMHAGDPDNKWKVTEPGVYSLTFNLRNWTMSSTYLREQDAPEIVPIETENLYIVGDASPLNEWNIDNPTPLEKKSQYEFVYEGPLYAGELKACTTTGDWGASFIRPASSDVTISESGISDSSFVFTTAPDNKWKVTAPGIYRLTFNLHDWTVAAEYKGAFTPSSKLYMIGEATAGGWSWDAATVIKADKADDELFVWEGELARGTFKAAREKSFDAPFYRPDKAGCTVSKSGASSAGMVFTTGPDDQWEVTEAGKYRLTFNTREMTFKAVYLEGGIQTDPLYMIGSATPGGWDLGNATQLSPVDGAEGRYTWTGKLSPGEFKFCVIKDFGAPFYRPSSEGCTVSKSGVSANDMIYTAGDPDYKWNVVDEGTYEITADTNSMTISIKYIK